MIADMNRAGGEEGRVEQLAARASSGWATRKSPTEEVVVRSAEVENPSGEKVELQNQLNTVYYIVEAEKELLTRRSSSRIHRTDADRRTNINFDSFTMADSRLLSEVPVG